MLEDMIMALVTARTKKQRERAYRDLERVGVDRRSADVMADGIRRREDRNKKEAGT